MVVGGGLIFVTGVGGFVGGVVVDQWLTNGDRVPRPIRYTRHSVYSGQVSYQGMVPPRATMDRPAVNPERDLDRWHEINDSTPENPVVLTLEEACKMNPEHVLVHIQTGRFKLEELLA